MLLSVVFIIKKLVTMNIDYKIILNGRNLILLCIFSLLYGVHMVILSVPWRNVISIITGYNAGFLSLSQIMCKANLLKYLPGNVFQYVGRNEAALRYHLDHLDIALSTGIDVLLNVGSVFLLSLIMNYQGIVRGFVYCINYNINVLFVLLIIGICGLLLLCVFLRKKFFSAVSKIKVFFIKRNISKMIGCILYYMFLGLYTGAIYFSIIYFMLDCKVSANYVIFIISGYLISWITGFIMPGAPGGIGVREATITIILSGIIPEEILLIGIVVYRVVNILGDLIAFLFTDFVYRRLNKQARCEGNCCNDE